MKHKLYVILLITGVLYSTRSQAQSYDIYTYAGNGTGGYFGDGGLASSAELNWPASVAVDDSGNLFIADLNNNVIRKINLSTKLISTVAGNYAMGQGYTGDGGPATAAQLHYPISIAVDKLGNLYIDDQNNSVIRVVNKGDTISTFAGGGSSGLGDGGPAKAANLVNPDAVAVDDSGNVYIADYSHERIRKVNKKTGIITTVAGNGVNGYTGDGGPATAAEIWGPEGVAIDKSGNLYISDWDNDVIRKVNTGDTISTFAGNGTANFSGDGGQATSAELHAPIGLTTDDTGNVYICDAGNSRVRKVNAKGIISTIAGGGSDGYTVNGIPATDASFTDPNDVVFDASGNVYICDLNNNVVRELTSATTGIISIKPATSTVTVYPNPNNGNFMVHLQTINPTTQIEVFNMLGQNIYTAELNSNNTQINLGSPVQGIYLFRISTTDGQFISGGKFVIE